MDPSIPSEPFSLFYFTMIIPVEGTFMYMIYSPIAWLFSATWLALVSVRVRIGSNPEFSARERGMCSRASANARKEYCSIVLILSAAAPTAMEQAISEAPPEIWKKYFYRLVIWQKKMWVLKNKSEFILLSWYLSLDWQI